MKPCSCGQCRLCFLYASDPAYRRLWDGMAADEATPQPRALPCLFLGPVLARGDCPCPAKWTRRCELHGTTTLDACKGCSDYITEG